MDLKVYIALFFCNQIAVQTEIQIAIQMLAWILVRILMQIITDECYDFY